MTRFRYSAAAADGRVVAGQLRATEPDAALAVLTARGLFPLELHPAPPPRTRPASRRGLTIAFRSLATLVSLGVPVDRALAITAAQPIDAALRQGLVEARLALQEGERLSDALAHEGAGLPAAVLGLLRAGERGSQLGSALEQAAEELEREADIAGRIRQALAYPLVILAAGLASLVLIGGMIVPRFADLLADLGQQAPASTRLLLAVSLGVRDHWLAASAVTAGLIAGGLLLGRQPAIRSAVEAAILRLPLVGPLRLGFARGRAARALGALLEAGAPMLSALKAAGEAAALPLLGQRIARASQRVAQGTPLTAALEAEAVLEGGPLQLVAVGEASGRLGTMVRSAGELAEGEAEAGLRTAVSLLEPAMVILLGGLVAFVALALLQAVYSLRPGA